MEYEQKQKKKKKDGIRILYVNEYKKETGIKNKYYPVVYLIRAI